VAGRHGIIVLSIAILPFLGIGGMELYKAETPSPVVDKLTPRIADTARSLWKIYILLTLVLIWLLLMGGMSLFDSVCHSFAALPTGGFSTKNASVGYYQSAFIDYIILIFIFLAGINFSLHFKLVSGRIRQFFRDPNSAPIFSSPPFLSARVLGFYAVVYSSLAMRSATRPSSDFDSHHDGLRHGGF
jgi:trk system potassium uptake protein TrkH